MGNATGGGLADVDGDGPGPSPPPAPYLPQRQRTPEEMNARLDQAVELVRRADASDRGGALAAALESRKAGTPSLT